METSESTELEIEFKIIDESEIPKGKKQRRTSNRMTKYEYTGIIAFRGVQISNGIDNPKIDVITSYEPLDIAREELHKRIIPLGIQRTLKNGTKEFWNVGEMIISDF